MRVGLSFYELGYFTFHSFFLAVGLLCGSACDHVTRDEIIFSEYRIPRLGGDE
jgi:hypothetical protein